jgi:hypothetical protein
MGERGNKPIGRDRPNRQTPSPSRKEIKKKRAEEKNAGKMRERCSSLFLSWSLI